MSYQEYFDHMEPAGLLYQKAGYERSLRDSGCEHMKPAWQRALDYINQLLSKKSRDRHPVTEEILDTE